MNHQNLINAVRLAVIAGLGVATSALAQDASKLPPPSTQTGITYTKDIAPIFKESCIRCHGPMRPKANLRLDSLEGVLKGSKDGEVVVPGKSDKSDLVLAICWETGPDHKMPPPPPPPRRGAGGTNTPAGGTNQPGPGAGMRPPPNKELTPEKIGLVRAWIDQGAK